MPTPSWRRPRRADERERRRADGRRPRPGRELRRRGEALAAAPADPRRDRRRRGRGPQQGAPEHRSPAGASGPLLEARSLHLCPRRVLGLHRDRGLRRARAAGRDRGAPRWRARRTGRDLGRADDRRRMGLRPGGRLGELPARTQAGARVPAPPRPQGADHPRALRPGRGLLLPPRRQDDRDRALHRAGPGPGAVHGRQLGDAVRLLPPVRRGGHRALGGGLRADRVLRLAEPRRGGPNRRPGHAPVRDRRRGDRRDRGRDPLPAPTREPQTARRGDGAPQSAPSAACRGALGGPSGALRVGAGDSRTAARPRVHDPAGHPRRQRVRRYRLHRGRLRRPGADAGRP